MFKGKQLIAAGALLLMLGIAGNAYTQNVAINADGALPDKNAMLDIKSANKGVLIPRITSEARLRIPNTQGMLVYDINTNSFWFNTGRQWVNMLAAAKIADSAWALTGNAGTVDGTNFIGTTDNVPFNIRVNNQRAGRIDPALDNVVLGYRSGFNLTTGRNNTMVGNSSLFHNTTGFDNTTVGFGTMMYNTTGFYNTAVGKLALHNNKAGYANTAVGASALLSVGGAEHHNTAVGAEANGSGGNYNTAVGANSQLFGAQDENTSVGVYTLAFYAPGKGNTAMGYDALRSVNPNTSYNSAFGHSATVESQHSYSVAIGHNALAQGSNSTALGYGAVANASNKVRIGNAAVTVIEGQVPFTFPSDGRFKYGVQEDVKGLDFILHLRPVTYNFDTKRFDEQLGNRSAIQDDAYATASNIRRSGFIAQEVEEAAKKAGYDFSGIIAPGKEQKHYSLSYDAFVMPLVKGMQEQQQIIQEQNKTIAELRREMEEIKKLLQSAKIINQ